MADLGTKTLFTHVPPFAMRLDTTASQVNSWRYAQGVANTNGGAVGSFEGVRNGNLLGVKVPGAFSGSVLEAGVPVPYCVVRCYQRNNGLLIKEVRTDANGLFTIPNVERGSPNHYVMALDVEGGAIYNALIFDRVAPV